MRQLTIPLAVVALIACGNTAPTTMSSTTGVGGAIDTSTHHGLGGSDGGTGRQDGGGGRGGSGGHGGHGGSNGDAGHESDAALTDGASDDGPSDDGPSDGADSGATSPDGGLVLPSPLDGVTTDDISNLSEIVAALDALPHKPTTRIVFDEGEQPAYYAQAVPAIHAVSYVMGELLDSEYVTTVSVAGYTQRTADYLAAFPTGVDLWEVGNEINGNWLGATADVVAKMTGAFDLVKAAGGHTELTLYGCSDSGASYDMFNWTTANIPARMLTGLDYVLVSYYDGDCGVPRAASEWPAVFEQLHQLFPNAGVGFGEVGSVDQNGNDLGTTSVAGPIVQQYYGLKINVPSYVGGYFWWYFDEDMVPKTKPLFATLSAAMQ